MNNAISKISAKADEIFILGKDKKNLRILNIDTERILPCPFSSESGAQRDDVDIVALADSIRQHGLISPITVRRKSFSSPEDDLHYAEETFEIIAGERRYLAMKMLGKESIPCIIIDADDAESAQVAIVENIMRKNLHMFEYAQAIDSLLKTYGLRQEELAVKMSTSQPNIANKLRLLRFSSTEREIILQSGLTERHARAVLRIKDDVKRLETLRLIAAEGMDLKETEAYVEEIVTKKKDAPDKSALANKIHAYIKGVISELSDDPSVKLIRCESKTETKITLVITKSEE